jgi:4-hydroxythreonine-4-phosphate dehydrogenase
MRSCAASTSPTRRCGPPGSPSPASRSRASNPHAGDGGNFGREEIDVIEPAVRRAAERGIPADGPFPSDTVFLRAKNGDFDAVLTMYHDQGQIAMKMMGFDRGVTLIGGFPFPICTPAHGTAYEIAGRGVANMGASRGRAPARDPDGRRRARQTRRRLSAAAPTPLRHPVPSP